MESLFGKIDSLVATEKRKIKLVDVRMEPSAILLFKKAYQGHPEMLESETAKLYVYSYGGEKQILAKDLIFLCRKPLSSNVFEFSEALFNGRKGEAYKILRRELDYGTNPQQIFYLILGKLRAMLWLKTTPVNFASAGYFNLHPFRFKKLSVAARNFTFESLKSLYAFCGVADVKIKTGKWDPTLALELLIQET